MVGESSVKWFWMSCNSFAGVVSNDMSVVSAVSWERLFVMSIRIAAQSWTYFLYSCVPGGGGVVTVEGVGIRIFK